MNICQFLLFKRAFGKRSTSKFSRFHVLGLGSQSQLDKSKSRPNDLKRHVAYITSNPSYLVFRRGTETASNTKQHPVCLSLSLFSPPLHLSIFSESLSSDFSQLTNSTSCSSGGLFVPPLVAPFPPSRSWKFNYYFIFLLSACT